MAKGATLKPPAKADQGRAFDRFSAAMELPLTVLTVGWLPVLIVPLFVHLHGSVDATFNVVDYSIWALFALEYTTKLCLARHRWLFVRSNLLDLLVVAVPILRPLRVLRLIRLTRIASVGADGSSGGRPSSPTRASTSSCSSRRYSWSAVPGSSLWPKRTPGARPSITSARACGGRS